MDEHTDNPLQSLFVVDVHNTDRSKNRYSQVQALVAGTAAAELSGRPGGWFALWQGQQLSSGTHFSRPGEVCLRRLSILLRHVCANPCGEKGGWGAWNMSSSILNIHQFQHGESDQQTPSVEHPKPRHSPWSRSLPLGTEGGWQRQ